MPKLTLKVPFQTPEQAKIAKKTLEVDNNRKENEIVILYGLESEKSILRVEFTASSNKILRTMVNATMKSLRSIVETFEVFDNGVDQL